MVEEIKIVSEDGIGRIDGGLASTDGVSTLFSSIWFPPSNVGEIRGVIQIVHGMSEYIARYENFAIELCRHGYIVGGLDHCGHGRSVKEHSQLGHLPINKGADILVQDAHHFSLMLRGAYPNVPFFLFGHSMGSFVTRRFIADYPQGIQGAIICGTGQQPLQLSLLGNALCRVIGMRKGDKFRSTLIHGMAVGNYDRQIKDARTEMDWLTHDQAIVDDYISNPLTGEMFTVGAYEALTSLTSEVVTMNHARKVPADLPLFFIAGMEDPVGDCGKGVIAAVQMYRKAGVREVSMMLYPGMRHEVHNEIGKEKVCVDVLNWIEDHR